MRSKEGERERESDAPFLDLVNGRLDERKHLALDPLPERIDGVPELAEGRQAFEEHLDVAKAVGLGVPPPLPRAPAPCAARAVRPARRRRRVAVARRAERLAGAERDGPAEAEPVVLVGRLVGTEEEVLDDLVEGRVGARGLEREVLEEALQLGEAREAGGRAARGASLSVTGGGERGGGLGVVAKVDERYCERREGEEGWARVSLER